MTRRALLRLPLLGVPQRAAAAGLHITGRLTATEQEAQDGYFQLCGPTGTCHPTDTLVVTVHPRNPLIHEIRPLVGQHVQVSVFQVHRAAP